MKKILLFLMMCAFCANILAQWHKVPPPPRPVYNHSVCRPPMINPHQRVIIHRQPRVYMHRHHNMVRMRRGPVYYGGGWGVNVIFLQQPRVYVQQPRIVYTHTPRNKAEAGILEYMINNGDIVILVDQQPQVITTDTTVAK